MTEKTTKTPNKIGRRPKLNPKLIELAAEAGVWEFAETLINRINEKYEKE